MISVDYGAKHHFVYLAGDPDLPSSLPPMKPKDQAKQGGIDLSSSGHYSDEFGGAERPGPAVVRRGET